MTSTPPAALSAIPGFWMVADANTLRIGARHRSLRSTGVCLFSAIWWTVIGCNVPAAFRSGDVSQIVVGLGATLMGLVLLRHLIDGLFGRTEVRLTGTRGEVLEGVGRLVKRTPFKTTDITAVTEHISRGRRGESRWVILDGEHPVYFGGHWSDERRSAVIAALTATLTTQRSQPGTTTVPSEDARTC
jgi:hypothetical protein